MLEKKFLLSLQKLEPPAMEDGKRYAMTRERMLCAEHELLFFTLYESIKGAPYAAAHRTFVLDDDFITYDFNGKKWSRKMLDKILSRYKLEREVQGFEHAHELLKLQENAREKALLKRKAPIIEKMEQRMDTVGEMPKDFARWLDAVPLIKSRYIYYKAPMKKKKIREKWYNTAMGICTHCGKTVKLQVPKGSGTLHGQEGKCPHCRSAIQYKAVLRTLYLQDDAHVAVLVRAGRELCVREFFVRREYKDHFDVPTTRWSEEYRIFVRDDGRMLAYEQRWDYSSKQSERVWHARKAENMTNPPCVLYTKNLPFLLRETPYRYSGLYEFAKKKHPIPTADYLITYRLFPACEVLAKMGFARLLLQCLPHLENGSMGSKYRTAPDARREFVALNGKTLAELLPHTKKCDIKLLAADGAWILLQRSADRGRDEL